MNNKGFTLVEFTIWLFGIIVLFIIVINMSRDTLATSVAKPISDKQVFAAAENYVIKEDISFNNDNYVCVTKRQLEITGYLKKVDNTNRTIKLTRYKITKVINKIEYVNECE